MRVLIIVIVLVVVFSVVGWLQFSSPNGDPTIRVDTGKIEQDTSAIVDKAKEAVSEMGDTVGVEERPHSVTPVDPKDK